MDAVFFFFLLYILFLCNVLQNSCGKVIAVKSEYESAWCMECICVSLHTNWPCQSRNSPPAIAAFLLASIKTIALAQRHLNTAYVCALLLNVACRIVPCAVLCLHLCFCLLVICWLSYCYIQAARKATHVSACPKVASTHNNLTAQVRQLLFIACW